MLPFLPWISTILVALDMRIFRKCIRVNMSFLVRIIFRLKTVGRELLAVALSALCLGQVRPKLKTSDWRRQGTGLNRVEEIHEL
jgi:hypothetical protein